jgi:hypothetical protein
MRGGDASGGAPTTTHPIDDARGQQCLSGAINSGAACSQSNGPLVQREKQRAPLTGAFAVAGQI